MNISFSFSIPNWVLFFVAGWLVAAMLDSVTKIVLYVMQWYKAKLQKKLREKQNG